MEISGNVGNQLTYIKITRSYRSFSFICMSARLTMNTVHAHSHISSASYASKFELFEVDQRFRYCRALLGEQSIVAVQKIVALCQLQREIIPLT